MMHYLWWLIPLAIAVLFGLLIYWKATRLDRLHRAVLGLRTTVVAVLDQRNDLCWQLLKSEELDPASSLVLGTILSELSTAPANLVTDGLELTSYQRQTFTLPASFEVSQRALLEGQLSRALREIICESDDAATPDGRIANTEPGLSAATQEIIDQLRDTWYQVCLRRRFHNTRVREVRRLRRTWLVRATHLAGHAPMPAFADFDDALPAAWELSGPDAPELDGSATTAADRRGATGGRASGRAGGSVSRDRDGGPDKGRP